MAVRFSQDAADVHRLVEEFLRRVDTLEGSTSSPVVIFQDGKSKAYYIRCSIDALTVSPLLDLDARLIPSSPDSLRANRELLLDHNTYMKMESDAEGGREFSDIIVEYTMEYEPAQPLKVWGGQHRSRAIQEAHKHTGGSRFHGFRIYFALGKEQRTEVALISNTNINISNDLFDRQLEETLVGPQLRNWCQAVGLLGADEDFPAQRSRSERITTKLARTFLVNFCKGRERGQQLSASELDRNIYEPYLCESLGTGLDPEYEAILSDELWTDGFLSAAGRSFAELHHSQVHAVSQSKRNLKGFRNKALTDSVLAGWSYVAGLLQAHTQRLANHLAPVVAAKGASDPLNAEEMSHFKHDEDPPTYRGLGTRSALKDRQRMAQVFLARSRAPSLTLDTKEMRQAVSQVVGIKALSKGYAAE